jgi:cation diffusion facilitator CzcD-associated flavoprotein CzcO
VTGLAPRANRAAGWTVSIEEEGGGTYKEDFDLVVIATGLFSVAFAVFRFSQTSCWSRAD